mgnify:CR=1 FL=1
MNYTKGEWEVEPIIKGETYIILTKYHRYELARVFIHNGEQKTNAHLMASAPDMYEALDCILRSWTLWGKVTQPDIINARKVLAKAEGK